MLTEALGFFMIRAAATRLADFVTVLVQVADAQLDPGVCVCLSHFLFLILHVL